MEEPTTPDEFNDKSDVSDMNDTSEDSDMNDMNDTSDTGFEATADLSEDAPQTGARFATPPPPPPPTGAPAPLNAGLGVPPKRLSRTTGPISGVAGGLGDYFGVDPTLVRVGIVLTTLLAGPVIPIAYIAAWIIIPEETPASVAPLMSPQPPPPSYAPGPIEVG